MTANSTELTLRLANGRLMSSQKTDPVKDRQCPCGCGEFLAIYRGKRPLVCAKAWSKLPMPLRIAFNFARSTPEEKRAAAREILEHVRSQRPDAVQTTLAL